MSGQLGALQSHVGTRAHLRASLVMSSDVPGTLGRAPEDPEDGSFRRARSCVLSGHGGNSSSRRRRRRRRGWTTGSDVRARRRASRREVRQERRSRVHDSRGRDGRRRGGGTRRSWNGRERTSTPERASYSRERFPTTVDARVSRWWASRFPFTIRRACTSGPREGTDSSPPRRISSLSRRSKTARRGRSSGETKVLMERTENARGRVRDARSQTQALYNAYLFQRQTGVEVSAILQLFLTRRENPSFVAYGACVPLESGVLFSDDNGVAKDLTVRRRGGGVIVVEDDGGGFRVETTRRPRPRRGQPPPSRVFVANDAETPRWLSLGLDREVEISEFGFHVRRRRDPRDEREFERARNAERRRIAERNTARQNRERRTQGEQKREERRGRSRKRRRRRRRSRRRRRRRLRIGRVGRWSRRATAAATAATAAATGRSAGSGWSGGERRRGRYDVSGRSRDGVRRSSASVPPTEPNRNKAARLLLRDAVVEAANVIILTRPVSDRFDEAVESALANDANAGRAFRWWARRLKSAPRFGPIARVHVEGGSTFRLETACVPV